MASIIYTAVSGVAATPNASFTSAPVPIIHINRTVRHLRSLLIRGY
jgi:hypothetical protein